MSDLIKTYLPSVYRFGSTDEDGLTHVHHVVCTDIEQATGFANALFDGSPKQGRVTAPELVADYCFIHDAYVAELAAVDRERMEELETNYDRLHKMFVERGNEMTALEQLVMERHSNKENNDEH